jgi:hypothetical protein
LTAIEVEFESAGDVALELGLTVSRRVTVSLEAGAAS